MRLSKCAEPSRMASPGALHLIRFSNCGEHQRIPRQFGSLSNVRRRAVSGTPIQTVGCVHAQLAAVMTLACIGGGMKARDSPPRRTIYRYEAANKTVQRTGASLFAQRQIERHRRLAPVADLCVRLHETQSHCVASCVFHRDRWVTRGVAGNLDCGDLVC